MTPGTDMNDPAPIGELLSVWIDGETATLIDGPPAIGTLLTHPGAREQCVVYQTIGDALREGAAGVSPASDDFIRGVMGGLASGVGDGTSAPLIRDTGETRYGVAPLRARDAQVSHAANDAVFRWRALAGVACLVAVGTLAWHLLSGDVATQGPVLAGGARDVARSESQPSTVPEPVMIRDPRLDDLIAQHRQAAGVSAFQNGSGFLRAATYDGGGR
jgi:sigma-E factor negative regulatory protein RseA